MPEYRLYRLDSQSSHFIGAEEIHARDDEAAIHMIQQLAYGNSVELWEGERKVTRIDAPPAGARFVQSPERRPLH